MKKRLRLLSEVVLRTVKRSLAASFAIFFGKKNGGERGIRTLERENPLTIFETVAFGHSAISPLECFTYGFVPYFINIMHVCGFGNTEVKKK